MLPSGVALSLVAVVRQARPELAVPDEVEDVLVSTIARAEATWPGVRVAHERFARFLAERLDDDVVSSLAALETDDLYLACGCIDRAPAAVHAFEHACMPVIDRAIASTGATEVETADLRQIVRLRLLVPTAAAAGDSPPRLASYSGEGSLAAWVRVIATREASRLLTRERREVATDDDHMLGMLTPSDDPEIGYFKRLYRAEFKSAFQAAVGSLSARDRLLLQQHLVDGLGIDQLAAFHQVHRATTARWLGAARREVLDRTRSELIRRLQLSHDELDSIMRLISSRLDVSFPALLVPPT
jgi:RNA polymerase sigma-70 factor (ECF subfamily)